MTAVFGRKLGPRHGKCRGLLFLQRSAVEDPSKRRLNVANCQHGGQARPLMLAMPMTAIDYNIAISILIVLILWFVVEMRGLRKS
jgi:hypothetical protein